MINLFIIIFLISDSLNQKHKVRLINYIIKALILEFYAFIGNLAMLNKHNVKYFYGLIK